MTLQVQVKTESELKASDRGSIKLVDIQLLGSIIDTKRTVVSRVLRDCKTIYIYIRRKWVWRKIHKWCDCEVHLMCHICCCSVLVTKIKLNSSVLQLHLRCFHNKILVDHIWNFKHQRMSSWSCSELRLIRLWLQNMGEKFAKKKKKPQFSVEMKRRKSSWGASCRSWSKEQTGSSCRIDQHDAWAACDHHYTQS